ncbi:MAG TPA: 4'-phosphopantetheinyl transferase superfamily protein [Ktedonosporobacter sp.]|jgi:4'-phosphopantetheinyl transferase|nr:4'-phosphopantetheinyl transferase superfamily protein [Ktedonosporobacter sp.]
MNEIGQQWSIPPAKLALVSDEVHVWRASLQAPLTLVQHLKALLSPEETTKANRFYFDRDRNHYIVARGLLRTLLGRYLSVAPEQLCFLYNDYGKPVLEFPRVDPPLRFNVSHSHELALLAFSYQRELGVDVEYMRTNIEYEDLARHSFSPNEQAVLLALPPEVKQQAFFNCWTRKEAYIKARGMGLSLDLALFDVSLVPGESIALLDSREDQREVARWRFHELAPGAGYAGALAVEGQEWALRCWQWPQW